MSSAPLRDPQLEACGVRHGFGVRGLPEPAGLLRPKQVHGVRVVSAAACRGEAAPPEADAVVSLDAADAVGVVTADCVPVLLASDSGHAVAALHAGWRGIAGGVVEAGIEALCRAAECPPAALAAAIGPHIGPCCYEVDTPVIDALAARLADPITDWLRPNRPGHALLDLGAAVRTQLVASGLAAGSIGTSAAACTRCDPERFHSYRRDGARAGRLVHWIAPGVGRGEA